MGHSVTDLEADMQGPTASGGQSISRPDQLLFLTDEQLRQGIELMFFAYREFTADPDLILDEYGYGRAHHRALHFINRRPALTVNELLEILGVTKQSLNRVLRQNTAIQVKNIFAGNRIYIRHICFLLGRFKGANRRCK